MHALSPPFIVGMPHLSYGGLSENWLLKECGHLHWLLLAKRLALPTPDFRDSEGNRLYAAFTAVRIEGSDLHAIREHDRIRIHSLLTRVSRTQYCSTHVLKREGATAATVEMLSAFVRRAVAGSNRAVQRCSVVERAGGLFSDNLAADDFIRVARAIRADPDWKHRGFQASARRPPARFQFTPCPRNDFNGAEFLYFASFQAIVDRAEWHWWRESQARITARDLFFYGNIDIGESLAVVPRQLRRDKSELAHWCEIIRVDDARKIADVFTIRRFSGLPQAAATHVDAAE